MKLRSIASDVLIVAGMVAIGWGLWCVYPPAAWIVEGALVSSYGVLLGRAPL